MPWIWPYGFPCTEVHGHVATPIQQENSGLCFFGGRRLTSLTLLAASHAFGNVRRKTLGY